MKGQRAVLAAVTVMLGAGASAHGLPMSLEFNVDSAPKLGGTATLTARVSVNHNLAGVSVEIELPAGCKLIDSPCKRVADATPEAPVVVSGRVVVSEPGVKLIRAVARAEERPGVVWSCVRYVGLQVGRSSSRVIGPNDRLPTQVSNTTRGDGVRKGRAGALDLAAAGSLPVADTKDVKSVASESEPEAEHPLVVGGRWCFYDRADVSRGMREVEVKLLNGATGAVLAESATTENGNFLFPIVENPGADGVVVRAYTHHAYSTSSRTSVLVPDGHDWSGAYGADTDVVVLADGTRDLGTWHVENGSANEKAWWILDDVYERVWGMGGIYIGRIVVEWSPTNTDGTYFDNDNYYGPARIHLAGGDADDTPDALLHQVGHQSLGVMSSTELCSTPLFVTSSQGRAWSEGWADFWVMWATNDPVIHYPGGGGVNLETPTWGDGFDTGDAVYARVAGALWDIADLANEGYDICGYGVDDSGWYDVFISARYIEYGAKPQSLPDFWHRCVAHFDWLQQEPLAAMYQSTIDYSTTPTLAALPDVTMDEDETRPNCFNLRGYASDAESTDEELVFSVHPPNPNCGVTIDSEGYVDIDPVANWYGTSQVTIACSDAIETVYDTFTLTVNPVNDRPQISGIPDVTLAEDTPRNNAIYLPTYASDVDDSPSELDYAIVNTPDPNCGVTLDASHYIDINPAANWYGATSVSVQVSDPHGLASADVFTIQVTSVNDTPVISGLPNRSLPEDTSLDNTIDLWAYTSDVETSDTNLVFSISHNTDSRCGVTIDGDRYIDIEPDADWDGVADVTIRARDSGGLWDEDTFRVTVTGVNDPPTIGGILDILVPKTVGDNDAFDLDQFASDPESTDAALTFTIISSSNEYAGVLIDAGHCVDVSPKQDWTGYSDVVVRVTDPGGLWAEDTFRIVVANLFPNIASARANPTGAWVGLTQRYVSATFSDRFYIQDPGRMSGIYVNYAGGPAVNTQVRVAGPLSTSYGERRITPYLLQELGASPPVRPLAMTNGAMGGASPDPYTPAVPPSGRGLYNVGLLVRTTGQVMYHPGGASYYIWDGSSVIDSYSPEPWLRVQSLPSGWRPPVGSWVSITGISGSAGASPNYMRVLRPRSDSDVVINAMRVAYVYRSNPSEAAGFKKLLDGNRLPTRLVSFGELNKIDWSPYHVVIIGNDTGPWDAATAAYVTAAGTPVVGIGAGGVLFFEQVTSPNLYLGAANSTPVAGQQNATVMGGDIYSYPYELPSSPGAAIQVVNSPGIYAASLNDPGGATLRMLRQYGDGTHFVLAGEGSRFYQWGFYGQPDKMTEQGKQLFVNLVFRSVRP